MRILSWIVRILAVLLLLRMLLRYFFRPKSAEARGRRGPRAAPKAPERLGGELVRDPQCGTYVPKSRAIVLGSGVGALYFCSTNCRDAYAKNARFR